MSFDPCLLAEKFFDWRVSNIRFVVSLCYALFIMYLFMQIFYKMYMMPVFLDTRKATKHLVLLLHRNYCLRYRPQWPLKVLLRGDIQPLSFDMERCCWFWIANGILYSDFGTEKDVLPDLWASATTAPEWLSSYMGVLSGSVAKTTWVSTDCWAVVPQAVVLPLYQFLSFDKCIWEHSKMLSPIEAVHCREL